MKTKLWNKDFILLMQGKFVSNIGDVLYSVALSFWILQTTQSKSLMGILLACQTLVKVILSPFGGVLCDRLNRKHIIVYSDAVCGATMLAISVLGFMNCLEVWMIFAAGIMMALCSAIFEPTMSSVFPDLIPQDQLSRGLSFKQSIVTIVQIIGQSVSGVLLSIFGPLLIFLGNGISFFISSFTESFIAVPKKAQIGEKLTFFEDFKSGLHFMNHQKGLKATILTCCLLNFFGNGLMVLLLPYFMETPSLLAETGYGICMGLLTVGTLIGVIGYGLLKTDGAKRWRVFTISVIIECISLTLLPIAKGFYLFIAVAMIFGFGNAILNVVLNEVQYEIIPQEMRGKVFGMIGTMTMGLTPIAMASFSILADYFGTAQIVMFGSVTSALSIIALIVQKEIRHMIKNKPIQENLEMSAD